MKKKSKVKKFDVLTKIISTDSEDKIADLNHKEICDLQEKGFKPLSVAAIPFEYYPEEDFRSIVTYVQPHFEEEVEGEESGK